MRVKAPSGVGSPSVGGIALKPDADGTFEVDGKTGALLIESFGFVDADAPAPVASAPATATSPAVRDAALAMLEAVGVKLADPSDDLIIKALSDLPKTIDARVMGAAAANNAGTGQGAPAANTAAPAAGDGKKK